MKKKTRVLVEVGVEKLSTSVRFSYVSNAMFRSV